MHGNVRSMVRENSPGANPGLKGFWAFCRLAARVF
jgi:hypothetical protein